MKNDLEQKAFAYISAKKKQEVEDEYYCQSRDIFQARLDKMTKEMLAQSSLPEELAYIISAITGEIGNNSFDHNIGTWFGLNGIFFAYSFEKTGLKIVLADAGQGIFNTLKRVKPEIRDCTEALDIAFNQKISGRAPESRGNGLKFVKINIKASRLHLTFFSGDAKLELNEKQEISKLDKNYQGCIAILTSI